jgi:NADH-quinone oxidoreductase subunit G
LVTIAAHDGALVRAAGVVLPAASWAEASGSYVNAKGTRQLSEKALEPLGSSRPAWFQLAQLAQVLGHKPTWGKVDTTPGRLPARAALAEIRTHLTGAGNPSHPDAKAADAT